MTSAKEFRSTSQESLSLLHVSFKDGVNDPLGCKLVNCDKHATNGADDPANMFLPGYAVVSRVLPGETAAKKAGVHVGDCIIAVNGTGFRRFSPDYKHKEEDLKELTLSNGSDLVVVDLDHRVVPSGSAYDDLLTKIKAVKAAGGDPPLLLTLERYGWDERPNSWPRFLTARENNVPEAMQMLQEHELWKAKTFPINLLTPGLQKIMRTKAVSEIDVESALEDFPPTVYVNYGALMSLQAAGDVTADDIVSAFVIFTERMLSKATDPRHPKTCQFIDLSNVSITSGFRVDNLKKIYKVFEPNYPETLFKMVIYPVSTMMGTTARTLLSFVNEQTQKKFLISNSLDQVCTELGWDKAEVESCGGVTDFMHKHEKAGTSMVFE